MKSKTFLATGLTAMTLLSAFPPILHLSHL